MIIRFQKVLLFFLFPQITLDHLENDELKLSLVKMKEHKGDDFQGRSYLNREQEKGTKFLGAD